MSAAIANCKISEPDIEYVLAAGEPLIVLAEITVGPAVAEVNIKSVKKAPGNKSPLTIMRLPHVFDTGLISVAEVETFVFFVVIVEDVSSAEDEI